MQLGSLEDIDIANEVSLKLKLGQWISKDWNRYAKIFAANAYLQDFLAVTLDEPQLKEFIIEFGIATAMLQWLLELIDVRPYDITLFRSTFNEKLHNPARTPIFATQIPEYDRWLKQLILSGQLTEHSHTDNRDSFMGIFWSRGLLAGTQGRGRSLLTQYEPSSLT